MKKSLCSILVVSALIFSGCSNKELDMSNPNLRTGKIVESSNVDVSVDIISTITNLEVLGFDNNTIKPSSTTRTVTTTLGTLAAGIFVGGGLSYGATTALHGHYVDASKIKINTNDNEIIEAYVQMKDFPINHTIQFEKSINEDPIQLIKVLK